jgi:hypothetical protein
MSLRETLRVMNAPNTIITSDYRRWLRKHHDDPYPDWVVELIRAELAKGGRDRSGSFSGSSAGSCMRAQEFEFLGVSPPMERQADTDLISIYDDGRWRHLRWQANLLTSRILSRIEFPLDWPAKRSKGSMDGLGVVKADHANVAWRGLNFGFELKGMNGFQYPRAVKEPLPTPKHMQQIGRYFLSSGVDLFVCIYECKLTQKFHEWVITPDMVDMVEQQQEIDELNAAVDRQQIHPQLKTCAARQGPYWAACGYAGKGGVCETWRDWGKTWH